MSCPMPAWIKVASVRVHDVSRHPPPIPIQLDEYSASPDRRGLAFGTTHVATTEWKVLFFSSAPCTYPDQLKDWFAATTTNRRARVEGAVDGEPTSAQKRI